MVVLHSSSAAANCGAQRCCYAKPMLVQGCMLEEDECSELDVQVDSEVVGAQMHVEISSAVLPAQHT